MTKKYQLTPEHEAQLPAWRDKWIANALSTKAMDDVDRSKMVDAIKGLYQAANLPLPLNIVFVPSPFVLRFAGGFAAELLQQKPADRPKNFEPQVSVIEAPADVPLPTDRKELEQYYICPNMREIANKLGNATSLFSAARDAYNMWQGGNQWSSYAAFLSFFRHVAKLEIDYSKWQHWEAAAIHGGPRIMHADFCMVSDRPEVLKVDDENRSHCEDGPFCRWRDGTAIYAWRGVYVPAWWIERKDELDAQTALTWENIEERRAACEIVGWHNVLRQLNAKTIDKDEDPSVGELVEVNLPDNGPQRFLRVLCGTGREFAIPVPRRMKTALEANASTYGVPEDVIRYLEVRT